MRRDRLRCGKGGVREEMHAYSLFVSRFVQFFFFFFGGGEPYLPLQFQFKLSVICRHLICICVIS